MITVTLNFNTISAAVAALRDIPEAAIVGQPRLDVTAPPLEAAAPQSPAAAAQASSPAPSPRTAKGATATAAPAQSTAKPSALQSTPAPAAPAAATSAPADAPLDYAVLKAAVLRLVAISTDAAVKVNAGLGVSSMRELDQARWPEALAAVNAKIAELQQAA